MIHDIEPHTYKNEFLTNKPDSESYFLYFNQGKILLTDTMTIPQFKEMSSPLIKKALSSSIYLFSIDERQYYLIDETKMQLPDIASMAFYKTDVFRTLEPLQEAFAGITGAQLHRFYLTNSFCGCCGKSMIKSTKERAMVCSSCNYIEYPKISPAVIVGVIDGDKILLTKYTGREYVNFALIAGFTEIGESLEQTVHRELFEEVGIHVKNITYYKNQPWAFTDTLLAGYFAELDGSSEIHLDESELSSAVWMPRGEIPDSFTPISLTHEMIMLFRDRPEAVRTLLQQKKADEC